MSEVEDDSPQVERYIKFLICLYDKTNKTVSADLVLSVDSLEVSFTLLS